MFDPNNKIKNIKIMAIQNNPQRLNILLWILQVILGGMFIMAGFMKVMTPMEELVTKVPIAKDMPELIRFIGVSELLGGLGLILPSLLRIQPKLTVWAGYALALVMVLAAGYHIMHGEYSAILFNLILGGIAFFIAWGRSKKAPIAAKG
jgi:putative oxidoreductase